MRALCARCASTSIPFNLNGFSFRIRSNTMKSVAATPNNGIHRFIREHSFDGRAVKRKNKRIFYHNCMPYGCAIIARVHYNQTLAFDLALFAMVCVTMRLVAVVNLFTVNGEQSLVICHHHQGESNMAKSQQNANQSSDCRVRTNE